MQDVPQGGGGLRVAAGYGVGVLVEGGGAAAVIEPAGYNDEGDAGVEHLGGHEVAEVAKAEGAERRRSDDAETPS